MSGYIFEATPEGLAVKDGLTDSVVAMQIYGHAPDAKAQAVTHAIEALEKAVLAAAYRR
jgi:hypothetical protein